MTRRLYVGRLPSEARSEDVSKLFEGYGRIVDCRVMTGFGFVEFESSKDAEDAVQQFNGKAFMGANIVVEFAKESRPRRDHYEDRHGPALRARRPPGIRIIVSGISRDTSWQDLKDFGRDAGNVSFADIDRDVPGQGILEYLAREDADRAVKELDGKDLRGRAVRVDLSDTRSGPDNYRRDDRRDDRYRDDRFRDDRYREDRHREDRYRRERSRSPPRRDYDDRRRKDDERKSSGYDDYRRGGVDDYPRPDSHSYYDRRRDEPERRRDRREDKDDRYDDRSKHNGEYR
ncbi:hypothetical protein DFH05DRAFT_426176 [Lentinula detonsa]|uniref:RRM domain-containing protein n=1 Tax=Lentinula detonsa TaxID=2804962 RepID=A0A9W8TUB2_9AGAR|nr:hypothetical protein DFH05DRAFT_426176 [Lentinula detonsa]KAJ3984486.1 hypothetical protein F5890DRAFT_1411488 [Lentinula detonsa]